MTDVTRLTIAEARAKLRGKEISALEITDAYLAAITAFTTTPPADAETVRRGNGDMLIYQASTNTFAVVDSDGVPRTMFKPDDGLAYWAKEKAAAPTFGQRRQVSESR